MMLSGLDETCYEEIWNAPENNNYAVQFRREGEREWTFVDFAVCKKTAFSWLAENIEFSRNGTEYRVVQLSRYPPCSVTNVIKYFKGT